MREQKNRDKSWQVWVMPSMYYYIHPYLSLFFVFFRISFLRQTKARARVETRVVFLILSECLAYFVLSSRWILN